MNYNFCTYFDSGYLLKGLALHESLERHCPEYHLWILALDGEALSILTAMRLPNTSIVSFESFDTPELQRAVADRSTAERYWTYTPSWSKYVLENAPVSHVAYIDADNGFFEDPSPAFEEMRGKGVSITPHRFPPKYASFASVGTYNVGLVYFEANDLKAKQCLDEWERLCIEWCYFRHDPDNPYRYGDQAYWDLLVPKYDVWPIQHLGAGLAPWNVEGFQYAFQNNRLHVDGQPLLWYHFHGLQTAGDEITVLSPQTYTIPPLVHTHVYEPYVQDLKRAAKRAK